MNQLGLHLRNKFLAGALALVPIVVVVFGSVWLEQHTQPLAGALGLPHIPGLGVLLVLLGVYLLGVVVTSLVGGLLVRRMDYLLERIPGLNLLYRTWKDILVLPGGKAGVFHKVVLVPGRDGGGKQIGFTSAVAIPGETARWSVFVPSLPNPLSGQLILFPCQSCQQLDLTVEDAFKFLLSSGNFLPARLTGASTQPGQLGST